VLILIGLAGKCVGRRITKAKFWVYRHVLKRGDPYYAGALPNRLDETVYIADTVSLRDPSETRPGRVYNFTFEDYAERVRDRIFRMESLDANQRVKVLEAVAFALVDSKAWVAVEDDLAAMERDGGMDDLDDEEGAVAAAAPGVAAVADGGVAGAAPAAASSSAPMNYGTSGNSTGARRQPKYQPRPSDPFGSGVGVAPPNPASPSDRNNRFDSSSNINKSAASKRGGVNNNSFTATALSMSTNTSSKKRFVSLSRGLQRSLP
jgi:hypothetical protein